MREKKLSAETPIAEKNGLTILELYFRHICLE